MFFINVVDQTVYPAGRPATHSSQGEQMMHEFTHLRRREFLVLAGSTVGGMLTAHAGQGADPRYVSLGDAHNGTQEIDLRIMNQYGDQPAAVQNFYVACREAMTEKIPIVTWRKSGDISNEGNLEGRCWGI